MAVYNKRLLAGYLDYIIIVLLLTAMRFKIVLGQPCHFKSLFVTRGDHHPHQYLLSKFLHLIAVERRAGDFSKSSVGISETVARVGKLLPIVFSVTSYCYRLS